MEKLDGYWERGKQVIRAVEPTDSIAAIQGGYVRPDCKSQIDKQSAQMMRELSKTLKPYHDGLAFTTLPPAGIARDDILAEMERLKNAEEDKWRDGFVSGAVYNGDEEHVQFLNRVYAINSQSNPLHADVWPSTTKFEAEIVAMTAHMLGAGTAGAGEVCGTVSSGGTESILLAIKTYRDRARDRKGITAPEMIVPTTAHAAFDKAAQYFGIKMIRIPVRADCKADVDATRNAITRNTVVVVGSAPSFPHGVIDPIAELSDSRVSAELASTRTRVSGDSFCRGQTNWAIPYRRSIFGCPA